MTGKRFELIRLETSYAHDVLTAFLEEHDFEITRHYAGLKTAWRAEYSVGHGGRVLGINSEMDALPGIGHACGHNLIAMSGVGIAVAVKTALVVHGIPGKVVILGTPGMERLNPYALVHSIQYSRRRWRREDYSSRERSLQGYGCLYHVCSKFFVIQTGF